MTLHQGGDNRSCVERMKRRMSGLRRTETRLWDSNRDIRVYDSEKSLFFLLYADHYIPFLIGYVINISITHLIPTVACILHVMSGRLYFKVQYTTVSESLSCPGASRQAPLPRSVPYPSYCCPTPLFLPMPLAITSTRGLVLVRCIGLDGVRLRPSISNWAAPASRETVFT